MADQPDVAAFFQVPEVDHPALSPGDERVAFLHDGTGRPELYVLDLDGGDTTRLTDGDLFGNAGGRSFAWGADGEGLYVVACPDDDRRRSELVWFGLAGERERVRAFDGATGLHDVAPDGEVLLADARNDRSPSGYVDRLDPETGTRERLHDEPWVREATYSPSGSAVACTVLDVDTDGPRPRPRAHVVDRDGRDRTDVDLDGGPSAVVGWLDDRRLALGARDGKPAVWNRESDEATAVEAASPDDRPLGVLGDGRVLVAREGRPTVLDGEDARTLGLPHGDRVTDATVRGDRAVLLADARGAPAGLCSWGDDGSSRCFVPDATDYPDPPTPGEVTFEGGDGDDLDGLLFSPDADGSVPGLVWPYTHRPAPHVPEPYRDAIRLLLDRGFVVFVLGNRPAPFSSAVRADVAAAGRWLAGHDATDGRVAVYGHSTGGYDALVQAACHPEVWAAAVASNAPTDLLALDDYRGGPADLRDHLPDPDEEPDAWRERSPVHRAGDVDVPLLLLHAEHDTRVPLEQAERMVDALVDAGKREDERFEFAVLEGQGHFSRAVEDRARRWELVLDFLGRQL